VGIDLKGTSKEALDKFIELGIETYIFYTKSALVFHPKIYIFENVNDARIIIGSANLTTSGLSYNVESAVSIEFEKIDKDGADLLKQIQDYYLNLFSKGHPNLAKLDYSLLEKLIKLKLVSSDVERRKTQEKNDNNGEEDNAAMDVKLLEELFPSMKFGKVTHLPGTNIQKLKSEPKLLTTTGGKTTSFWIQTGALTGGSGNQIDLSMSGPKGSIGSVSLFGIDPNKTDTVKIIKLQYNGVTFQGNTIKFPINSTGKTNGTWRMQLHGQADSGEKLTETCSKYFRHSILLFKEIGKDYYKITLFGENTLGEMKKKSVFWDQNSSKRGKHFGKIQ